MGRPFEGAKVVLGKEEPKCVNDVNRRNPLRRIRKNLPFSLRNLNISLGAEVCVLAGTESKNRGGPKNALEIHVIVIVITAHL